MEIVGLSYSQTQSGAYALVLGETSGKRRLPIIIGGFEAQAIAIELEKMQPTRPLTHDLFKSFAENFDIEIEEVIVYNLVEGIFFAKLICKGKNMKVELDARTSDAIALAVRFNCPIYTYEFILSSAGIILEEKEGESLEGAEIDIDELTSGGDDPQTQTVEELKQQLEDAIGREDYEAASKIRDEIKRRTEKN